VKDYKGLLLFLAIFVSSCAAPAPTPTPKPAAEPASPEVFLKLHLKADPELNLHGGKGHALHLCVYQLIDANAFRQLSEDEGGLYKLMNCDRFDAGVALARRLVIQPGEDRIFELDEAEGVKYVGIVAGYYALQKKHCVRLYPVQTVEEKKGGQVVYRPMPIKTDLILGPQGIRNP